MTTDLPYRPCVGVVLANRDGLVFVGERIDTPGAWQMPQGGIDDGETPENAAIRELYEETGVPAHLVEVIAEHPDWIPYDLPDHLNGKLWGGRYKGQTQKWFLLRFQGDDDVIDLKAKDEEFAQWRWSTLDDALAHIVPFKRPVYERVLSHFAPMLEG